MVDMIESRPKGFAAVRHVALDAPRSHSSITRPQHSVPNRLPGHLSYRLAREMSALDNTNQLGGVDMRRILIATLYTSVGAFGAIAADGIGEAPFVDVPVGFDWTGAFVGAQTGYR